MMGGALHFGYVSVRFPGVGLTMRAPTIEFQLQFQLSTCSSSVDLELNPRYLIWSSSSRSLALESQLNFFDDSGLEEAASHDTDHDTRPRSWSSIYTRAKTLPLNCFPYQTCWSLGKIAVLKMIADL